MTYFYRGPVYRFDRCVIDEIEFYTDASSRAKAIVNFKMKAKKRLGLVPETQVRIKEENVVLLPEPEFEDDTLEEPAKCERCGHLLADNGECPVCDFGEEDLNESLDLDILNELETDFCLTDSLCCRGPAFICPDGRYIDIISSIDKMGIENWPEDFACHAGVQTILREKGLCEMPGRFDDGCPVLRDLGYIRINDIEDENNFIELSPVRPTNAQYRTLAEWIDRNPFKILNITTPMMLEFQGYNLREVTSDEIIKKIKRYYTTNKLVENLITEANRNELISRSQKDGGYSNGKGSRWAEKSKCSLTNVDADYNKIDMDTFWKEDELRFAVKVRGETDNYTVHIMTKNVLRRIENIVKRNKNRLDFDSVYRALMESFSTDDIFIACDCDDFKYRLAYHASKNGFIAGQKETRASAITNPNDNKGACCKHILAVLSNQEWVKKISKVIFNYINYCKDHMEYNYKNYIFPKVYGITFSKAENDAKNASDDESKINLAAALGMKPQEE